MKRLVILTALIVVVLCASSQERLFIHKSDKISLGVSVASVDSIYFSSDVKTVYFGISGNQYAYPVAMVDSLSFGNNNNSVIVTYNGTSAHVINPLAFEGVDVSLSQAGVTVNATNDLRDIDYVLKGTASNGYFKLYSQKRCSLILAGVNITNGSGPAINIQTGNKVFVNLVDDTSNTLKDGVTYGTAPLKASGESEDQDAAFFSEGKLEFLGNGSLVITGIGTKKHAICSDDEIEMKSGVLSIVSAAKDGIHANDGINIKGGTINVVATGDAIDGDGGHVKISGGNITTINSAADVKAIKCDSTITISGGVLSLTLTGNQSKGIKAGQEIVLTGGDITIKTSGAVVLESSGLGYNPSYCTGIKGDSHILVDGANVTINGTGLGGKGISASGNFEMQSGALNFVLSGNGATYKNALGITDSYNATCLSVDGNLSIENGATSFSATGTGGKGISVDGTIKIGTLEKSPVINVTTSGAKFLVSGSDYCHPKAIKSAGVLTVDNGLVNISSSDDGLHSGTSIVINGGETVIANSVEGIESKYITINGGNVSVSASDDGINTTFSTVSGGTESNDGSCLYINGGYLMASTSKGDALDSNGNIVMTGGTVVVHGPPSSPEEAVDFNGTFNISGGFFIAAGTNSQMNKAMSSTSTQYGVYAKSSTAVAANTIFRLQDSSGNDLVTFKPARASYSFLFSSPTLKTGTYYIYTGGTCTGTIKDGLYTGGTYSNGTLKKSFVISSKVTSTTF